MVRLVIKNLAELKAFHSKWKTLRATFPIIQKNAINEMANEDILDEIHNKMKLNDFSEKIINATFVGPIQVNNKKIRVHYISDYVADNGFDVSKGREEGTRDHPIKPKNPDGVLRWKTKSGEIAFSKGHMVSGMERLLIIGNTIKENQTQAPTLYGQKIAEGASRILGV